MRANQSRALTVQQLIDKCAYTGQVTLFKELFGDSVEVTVQAALEVADKFDWH